MKGVNWRRDMWFNHHKAGALRQYCGPGTTGYIRRGQIGFRFEGELNYEIPWAFVNMRGRGCDVRNEIFWQQFGIIPKLCRGSCWKVVIRPQSVYELYMFYRDLEQLGTLEGVSGKAGIDLRWYTPGRYAGFIYCGSQDEGQRVYEIVREQVEKSPNFSLLINTESVYNHELIILKKGCTEMQHPLFKGIPSDQWEKDERVPQWDREEIYLRDIFDADDSSDGQPEWLINKVIYAWCEYAYMTGDSTYKDVMLEDPFAYSEVTYHRKNTSKEGKGGDTLAQKGNLGAVTIQG